MSPRLSDLGAGVVDVFCLLLELSLLLFYNRKHHPHPLLDSGEVVLFHDGFDLLEGKAIVAEQKNRRNFVYLRKAVVPVSIFPDQCRAEQARVS